MASEFYAPGLMDLSSYRLEEINDTVMWDRFVSQSEQGSVFNLTAFLDALEKPIRKWGCYKGSELKGAICVVETIQSGTVAIIRPSLLIYNSILLPRPDPQQAKANQFAEEFRTVSAMVKELMQRYTSVSLQTHFSFTDLRPFLWHNYGTELPKFEVKPKFTAILQQPNDYA